MVFDLTDANSFTGIRKWIKQLAQVSDIPVVIVGNKCDLAQQRQVSSQVLHDLGSEKGVHTFETSAKTGQSIDSAFACLIYQVLKPCLAIRKQIHIDSVVGDHRLLTAAQSSTENPLNLSRVIEASLHRKAASQQDTGVTLPNYPLSHT